MDIVKPALTEASPGQPVTAQAWNEHVSAILELYDHLMSVDSGTTLSVAVLHDKKAVRDATVVATNGEDAVQAAIPIGGSDLYLLGGLTSGTWTVRVQAPGLASKEAEVEMPSDGTLTMAMEGDGTVRMPDLFGLTAKEALVELSALKLKIDTIFDTTGQELTKSSLTDRNSDATVLSQLPAADTLMSEDDLVRMVVGAKIAQQQMVAVPDVSGATLSEAEKMIQQAGLEVGQVGYFVTKKA